MTSYLVDAILLLALVVTTYRVTKMHRELKQLRIDQADFCSILGETAESFDAIVKSVSDLNHKGTELVRLLGVRIDEGRAILDDIDRRRAAPHATAVDGESPSDGAPAGRT
jgi:hypothetical protein